MEDVKHANLVHFLISEISTAYPTSVKSIRHGFNCFRAVYPIPLWRAAFRRAKAMRDGETLQMPDGEGRC